MAKRELGFIEKVKNVITNPSEFFDSIKSEKGVKQAFTYLALISLVSLAVGLIETYLSLPLLQNALSRLPIPTSLMYVFFISAYLIGLPLSFLSAGLIHLGVLLFKGKGNYESTYKAMVYGGTSSGLLGWIPFIGFVFILYSIYLETRGLSKLHSVSMWRALAMLLLIPLIIAAVMAVVVVLLIMSVVAFQLA